MEKEFIWVCKSAIHMLVSFMVCFMIDKQQLKFFKAPPPHLAFSSLKIPGISNFAFPGLGTSNLREPVNCSCWPSGAGLNVFFSEISFLLTVHKALELNKMPRSFTVPEKKKKKKKKILFFLSHSLSQNLSCHPLTSLPQVHGDFQTNLME